MRHLVRPLVILLSLAAPLLMRVATAQDAEAQAQPETIEYWKTAARLNYHLSGTLEQGSGTVIHSTPERSIVLTCAHIFSESDKGRLTVDLFHPDMRVPNKGPGQLRFLESHPAKWIAIDHATDVALVSFAPGRVLDSSPVSTTTTLTVGQPLTTVGCSNGKDATTWLTKVRSFGTYNVKGAIKTECEYSPIPGRSGGGLFNADDQVVGVCNFKSGDASDPFGLYAPPSAIHAILERRGIPIEETGRRLVIQQGNCPPGQTCPTPQAQGYASPQTPPITEDRGFSISHRWTPLPPKVIVTPPTITVPAKPPKSPANRGGVLASLDEFDAKLPTGSHLLAALVVGLVIVFAPDSAQRRKAA